MPQVQRYRRGPQRINKGKIQAGVKAQIGDMMVLVGNYMVPAAAAGTITTLAAFKAAFAGVLIEGATAGNETKDTDCLLGASGVYEFDLAAPLGAVLTAGKTFSGVLVATTVQNQQLAASADRTTAVALLANQANTGDSTVYVEIYPAQAGNPLA